MCECVCLLPADIENFKRGMLGQIWAVAPQKKKNMEIIVIYFNMLCDLSRGSAEQYRKLSGGSRCCYACQTVEFDASHFSRCSKRAEGLDDSEFFVFQIIDGLKRLLFIT